MARRKTMRRMRRGFVQRNEHFWTSILENSVSIGSNVLRYTPIVGPSDWVVRAGAATANLVRIRGHWDVRTANAGEPGGTGGSTLAYAIIVVDADDAVNFNPFTLSSLNENQVLWTRVYQAFQYGLASDGPVPATGDNFAIDVKVQRKLRPDDYVYMVTFNAPTSLGFDNSAVIAGIIRALIVVK